MILLIALGLAFLFFCVVAYFAAKSWHVGHVVAKVFLFLFALVFFFMTFVLFQCMRVYRPAYDKSVADIERAEQQFQRLQYGDPSTPAGAGSKFGELAMAREEQFTRGRVWRNVVRVAGPNQITLSMANWNNDGCAKIGEEEDFSDEDFEPEADPAADEGLDGADGVEDGAPIGPVLNHNLVDGQLVYAFKEFPIAQLQESESSFFFKSEDGEESLVAQDKAGRCRLPLVYMGKFSVTAINGPTIALVPSGIPDETQQRQLQMQDPKLVSWVLYEKLPTDTHGLFEGVEDFNQMSSIVPLARLTQMSGIRLTPQAYQAMMNDYLSDGKPVTGQVDPMRAAVEVKFLKDYSAAVDLDIEGELPAGLEQPFNIEGRAQVKSLFQGEASTFVAGDTAVFDGITAGNLIRDGIAEQVNVTYSRQLRNFEFLLGDYQIRFDQIEGQKLKIEAEIADLEKSRDRLQSQLDKQDEEYRLLEADLKGFNIETEQLSRYLEQLSQRFVVLKGEVDYLSNGGQTTSSLAVIRN